MNPLKNQNKFEDKLKKQMDGLETNPTDDLWDKIEQGIPEDTFEKNVASKLEALKINPEAETWAAIERRLPVFVSLYKRRVVLLLAGLVFLLGFISNYLLNYSYKPKPTSTGTYQNQSEQETKKMAKGSKEISLLEIKPNRLPTELIKLELSKKENMGNAIIAQNKVSKNNTNKSDRNTYNQMASLHNLLNKPTPENLIVLNKNEVEEKPKIDSSIATTLSSNKQEDKLLKTDSATMTLSSKSDASSKQVTNAENYSLPNENLLSIYSITAFTGYNMCYNNLVSPNISGKDFNKNIALRKSVETPTVQWTGAFLANLHINSKWYLSSGIILTNFKQDLRFGIEKPVNEIFGSEHGASYVHTKDSITNGQGQTGIISYSFTEIPFFVSYQFAKKGKFECEVQGGLSLGILSGVNAQMVDEYNVGLLQINNKDDFPPLRNVFFFTIQPMVSYKLNPAVNIGIMPTIKTSLNSMVATPYWVQQYPYFVGLNAFIRKRF